MTRKAFICRDTPGGVHCTTVIVGDDAEALTDTALEHVSEAHDLASTPELREVILASLRLEEERIELTDKEDRFDMVHPTPKPQEDVDDEAAMRDGFSTP